MSTAPIVPLTLSDDTSLTHDQWWELFDQARLAQQDDYAKYGGPVAFFRAERNDDADIA